MDIFLTRRREETSGPDITINCPNCGAEGVPARSRDVCESLRLFGLLPLPSLRNTFVVCGQCDKQLIARLPAEELGRYEPRDLDGLLVPRVFLVAKFLAIASVVLCWAPVVGFVLGVAGLLANRRTGGWPRTLSVVGAVLSSITLVFVIVVLIIGPPVP